MSGLYINPQVGAIFSLNGRLRTWFFLLATAIWYAAFITCAIGWSTQRAPVFQWIILLSLPLKFIVTGKRFHDVNLSALFASPILVLLCLDIWSVMLVPLHVAPPLWLALTVVSFQNFAVNVAQILLFLTVSLVALTDIGLMFTPGTKGPNRFGPDPRGHAPVLTEVF